MVRIKKTTTGYFLYNLFSGPKTEAIFLEIYFSTT
jgi:hypothetical protein